MKLRTRQVHGGLHDGIEKLECDHQGHDGQQRGPLSAADPERQTQPRREQPQRDMKAQVPLGDPRISDSLEREAKAAPLLSPPRPRETTLMRWYFPNDGAPYLGRHA